MKQDTLTCLRANFVTRKVFWLFSLFKELLDIYQIDLNTLSPHEEIEILKKPKIIMHASVIIHILFISFWATSSVKHG